jgi:tRNA A-37 threonylcarbamoyl transferase component Bud32
MRSSVIDFLDEASKQVRYLIVNGRVYVVKKYASEPGLIKWFLISASNLAIGKYPFKLDPFERLKREVYFMRYSKRGFSKPEILVVDYSNIMLTREFVKGDVYGYSAPGSVHYEVARHLGVCHEDGWVLGDPKISNFIYSAEGRVYIVDAEQAIREYSSDYSAWDLLVYVSTLTIDGYVKALYSRDVYDSILENIITGYLQGNTNSKDVFKTLLTREFKALIYFFIPFPFNYTFVKKIEKYVK